jgi:hypothetical protein
MVNRSAISMIIRDGVTPHNPDRLVDGKYCKAKGN